MRLLQRTQDGSATTTISSDLDGRPDEHADRVRAALAELLPEGALLTGPVAVERYSHDEAEWAPYEPALAVVRPRTAEQVQAVVRVCLAHGVPVVPHRAVRRSLDHAGIFNPGKVVA